MSAFFAGLFDAEGNVSLYNKSFRWACKNEKLIKIYLNFLKKLDMRPHYDGGCLVSYNKDIFYDKIYPYMKHNDKINLTKIMLTGKGILPKRHLRVLSQVYLVPQSTQQELSKALKENKMYSELRLLTQFGYINCKGYPMKFKITNKGLKTLEVRQL